MFTVDKILLNYMALIIISFIVIDIKLANNINLFHGYSMFISTWTYDTDNKKYAFLFLHQLFNI